MLIAEQTIPFSPLPVSTGASQRYCEKDTPGSAREKPVSLSARFCFNIIYLCTWHHNSALVHACVHTPAPETQRQGAACSLVITNNAHSKTHLKVLFWGSVSFCSMAFWHLDCRGASQTIKLTPELHPTHFKPRHQKMLSSPGGKNLDLLCNCPLTHTHQSLTFSCSTRLSEGSTALFKPDPSAVRAGELAGLNECVFVNLNAQGEKHFYKRERIFKSSSSKSLLWTSVKNHNLTWTRNYLGKAEQMLLNPSHIMYILFCIFFRGGGQWNWKQICSDQTKSCAAPLGRHPYFVCISH